MLKADDIQLTTIQIEGKWVAARPMLQPIFRRFKDAIKVLIGKADAVTFYKQ